MSKTLTRKQRKFVEAFVETGNGTQSALQAYETDKPNVAAVISTENLRKPNIIAAVDEILSDKRLEEKHSQLIDAVNLEKLWFDEHDEDADIEAVVAQMPGYKLLHIVRNLKQDGDVLNLYAYVSAPDNMTQEKALDKAYKLKGKYAAEKHLNVNVEVEASPVINELTKKLNDIYRSGNSIHGGDGVRRDGGTPSIVGSQTPDKE